MLTSQQYIQQILPEISEIEWNKIESNGYRYEDHPSLLIDVREPSEFAQGHIEGAINIPRGVLEMELEQRLSKDSPQYTVLLYCRSGGRSALAAHSLQQMGLNQVYSLKGGYSLWQSER